MFIRKVRKTKCYHQSRFDMFPLIHIVFNSKLRHNPKHPMPCRSWIPPAKWQALPVSGLLWATFGESPQELVVYQNPSSHTTFSSAASWQPLMVHPPPPPPPPPDPLPPHSQIPLRQADLLPQNQEKAQPWPWALAWKIWEMAPCVWLRRKGFQSSFHGGHLFPQVIVVLMKTANRNKFILISGIVLYHIPLDFGQHCLSYIIDCGLILKFQRFNNHHMSDNNWMGYTNLAFFRAPICRSWSGSGVLKLRRRGVTLTEASEGTAAPFAFATFLVGGALAGLAPVAGLGGCAFFGARFGGGAGSTFGAAFALAAVVRAGLGFFAASSSSGVAWRVDDGRVYPKSKVSWWTIWT